MGYEIVNADSIGYDRQRDWAGCFDMPCPKPSEGGCGSSGHNMASGYAWRNGVYFCWCDWCGHQWVMQLDQDGEVVEPPTVSVEQALTALRSRVLNWIVVYRGHVYCPKCLPGGAEGDEVEKVYVGDTWDHAIQCKGCGEKFWRPYSDKGRKWLKRNRLVHRCGSVWGSEADRTQGQ